MNIRQIDDIQYVKTPHIVPDHVQPTIEANTHPVSGLSVDDVVGDYASTYHLVIASGVHFEHS